MINRNNEISIIIVETGCGFIGRNLVEYLLDNDLVSFVRVVDLKSPENVWLNDKHEQIFKHPSLEFKKFNLNEYGNTK